LLTGLADVESAAPGLALAHIADMARAEPPARDAIAGTEPAAMRVAALPEGPTRRALVTFLRAYGYRGPREAEIATPRWSEDPSLLFAALRAQIVAPGAAAAPGQAERRQRAIRDAAAAELDRRVALPARTAVRHLLALVQRYMRLRERLRAHVTRVLGMFRVIALDVSRRISLREGDVGEEAAFFLTMDELHAVLRGELRSVAPLVRQRRRAHDRDAALPDPPDTFVGEPPALAAPLTDSDTLVGLPASSGRVQGLARVVAGPADAATLRAGEVLVAPWADVGWSPLFPVACAVVTDLGGPLSHAPVVLRELGVPAVVNVKVGTRRIRTGDLLEVDGDRGTVRILREVGRA
jgi:pyruvate,water dikinase